MRRREMRARSVPHSKLQEIWWINLWRCVRESKIQDPGFKSPVETYWFLRWFRAAQTLPNRWSLSAHMPHPSNAQAWYKMSHVIIYWQQSTRPPPPIVPYTGQGRRDTHGEDQDKLKRLSNTFLASIVNLNALLNSTLNACSLTASRLTTL